MHKNGLKQILHEQLVECYLQTLKIGISFFIYLYNLMVSLYQFTSINVIPCVLCRLYSCIKHKS